MFKSQRQAYFFKSRESTSIIGFLAKFELAGDFNRNHDGAAAYIFSFLEKNALGTTLNSRMSAATNIAPVLASVNTCESTSQKKLLCFYLEVANYFLEKFANYEPKTEMDFATLRYIQPAYKTST